MKLKLILTTVSIVIAHIALAQDFDKAKLDNYFDALEKNNKFMGSVAIAQNGKLLYSKSLGYANVEDKLKANENSKYRIGSISKTFTATLVLKAIEGKKLNLSQTLAQYFPTVKNADKITIMHLLYHRSGIHNFTDDEEYLSWNTQIKSEKELVEIISKAESDFEPDSRMKYSNSNYVLLTFILEKVFKKAYSELLKKYITQPLGLTNTYFGGKINAKNNECFSYKFSEEWKKEPETDMSIPLGAGSIVSTPVDLTIFSEALFNGKLLSKESLVEMKTLKDNFGMGLIQIPFYDKKGFGHTGGIDGFRSVFCHFSDNDVSYALTSNGTDFNNNNISIAVLSAVYNKPYDIPEFKTYDVTAEGLDKYIGVYSSTQLPLKMTITKNNKRLIGQATGQQPFPLEAFEKDKFKFEQAGVVIEFNPEQKTLFLKQSGNMYTFTKE